MAVRAAALARFGENNIRAGDPLATIGRCAGAIYMLHRYQVEAASKTRGRDGLCVCAARRWADADENCGAGRAAARAGGRAGDGEATSIGVAGTLLKMIPPRPPEFERGREHFKIRTSRHLTHWLRPKRRRNTRCNSCSIRCERRGLLEFHARDAANPSLEEVLDAVIAATWKSARGAGL